jgi:hypothetical protein
VRALFEIHGTAYMIMDFEDGVSLSRLLKEGRRFNERSLWNVIKPIAEGLDRAHRVGVLHRDIKPPNILITDDNRPVLIDFGSARFEAAEATSTSVTFHTPPYAAVEQYVKTYPQGPWTDIYAMSVVLYECVTGEKPPEVLERMHGGLGSPLADGHWPGFSKRFLQAIDAGMTIKPSERPQSIREWLALFGKKEVEEAVGGDDEPTRFFAHEMASDEIAAVAPTAPGVDQKDLDTGVPKDPADVQFKRAGEETGASKKGKKKADAAKQAAEVAAPVEPDEEEEEEVAAPVAKPAPEKRKPIVAARPSETGDKWYKDPRKAMLAGGGAVALVAALAAGTFMMGGGSSNSGEPLEIPDLSASESIPVEGLGQLIAAERTLVNDARTAGAPATAVNDLVTASDRLDQQLAGLQPLADDPAQSAAATARVEEMKRTATSANVAFATALLRDADAKAQSLPRNGQSPAVTSTLAELRTSVEASATSTDPVQSLSAARDALAKSQAFSAAITNAYGALAASKAKADQQKVTKAATAATTAPVATTTTAAPAATTTPATTSSSGTSASKQAQVNSIVSSGRALAKQVMKSGNKENAALARNYDRYLAEVANSARGARTDAEMDRLIKQANQTKAYLVFLQRQTSQGN